MADVFLTHGYFLNEDEKEQEIMRPYPPLGLLYISGHLKRAGLDTYLFDSTFSSLDKLHKALLSERPKVCGIYTNLMTKVNILRVIQFIKSELPDCKVILGGPDVTYNVDNYLKHGADYLIIGEGELTMEELAQFLLYGVGKPEDIAGIAYEDGDMVITTPPRAKIKNLEELALPDRNAIAFEKYLSVWKTHHGKRTANVSTQRGCPYTCKWCSTAVYGQSYRRRPANLVAEEIEILIEQHNVEALWFVDDVFTVSHKWLAQLAGEFRKREIRIEFECITRAERLNDNVLSQLKEMGCSRIWIGAESGSQRIIDKMDRRVDIEVVSQMMQRTQEYGMEAGTFIMVGYPSEELNDIKQTAQYLKKAQPDLLTITKTYPIKGTALYEEVREHITRAPEWSTSTDRDIEFELPYSKSFYNYAIRYIMNEYFKSKERSLLNRLKFSLKAKLAYSMMLLR